MPEVRLQTARSIELKRMCAEPDQKKEETRKVPIG